MKKIFSAILLGLILICCGVTANAQTPVATVTLELNEQGYPDIEGHTYRYKNSQVNVDFTFNKNDVTMTVVEAGQTITETLQYEYKDGNVKIIDPEYTASPMYEGQIADGGKTIKLTSGSTSMKLIK